MKIKETYLVSLGKTPLSTEKGSVSKVNLQRILYGPNEYRTTIIRL